MLTKYTGELLISPFPMELSMNYCSHKCAYCFANLNNPGRSLDAMSVINTLKNAPNSNTLVSTLIKEKYPILISNLVDPFAKSNYKATISLTEIITSMGIPIAWQTRGGDGIDDVLSMLETPQSWYISIPYVNENTRVLLEPGSTTIESRWGLIQKLKERGHFVSVGLNPLYEGWTNIDDAISIINKCKALGVTDIWIQGLHLNAAQVKNMSEREAHAMGEDVIANAKKRSDQQQAYVRMVIKIAHEAGMSPYFPGMPTPTQYVENISAPYKTRFKTNHDYINYLYATKKSGDFVRFSEYYEFIKNDIFEREFSASDVDGYAYRVARNVYQNTVTTPFRRIKDVIFWYWDNRVNRGLLANPSVKIACYKDDNKLIPYLCRDSGSYIGVFSPDGDDSEFIEL